MLGLKNTAYNIIEQDEFKEKILGHFFQAYEEEFEEVDFNKACEYIFGAIKYAKGLGFKPQKDFDVSRSIMELELKVGSANNFEYGYLGKPYFISGPFDNPTRILSILNKNVGEDNYEFVGEVTDDEDNMGFLKEQLAAFSNAADTIGESEPEQEAQKEDDYIAFEDIQDED